jgi:hypothetical protein
MTLASTPRRAAGWTVAVASVAAMTITVGPAARAEPESWGAIAVSLDGLHLGLSKDMPNELAANKAANINCQQDNPTCNVMISFHYPQCGAVVKTEDQYYRDLGPTRHEAEQNAISQSPKQSTKVLSSECNDAPSGK